MVAVDGDREIAVAGVKVTRNAVFGRFEKSFELLLFESLGLQFAEDLRQSRLRSGRS